MGAGVNLAGAGVCTDSLAFAAAWAAGSLCKKEKKPLDLASSVLAGAGADTIRGCTDAGVGVEALG